MDDAAANRVAMELDRMDPASAFRAGIEMLKADRPEALLLPAQRLAERHPGDHRPAQLLGLAARAAGDGPLACAAFAAAARNAPTDPLITHSRARTALEAGKPAVQLFKRALDQSPNDGSVIQGLAAAMVSEGMADDASQLLSRTLAANPLWLDGHRTYAQIRAQFGKDPLTSIGAALTIHARDQSLHQLRISLLLQANRAADALEAAELAMDELGAAPWLTLLGGHAASEIGQKARADAYFAQSGTEHAPDARALLARHAVRFGRFEQVEPLAMSRSGSLDHSSVPYLALAWRQLGDPRYDWLEGSSALVGIYDLADEIADLHALAEHLRRLHFAQAAPIDQSVRGGTQTDGNLLLRDEEPLIQLRKVLLQAVDRHIAKLPPAIAGHPHLIARRKPSRIAGSWSVRLGGAGFHVDHVHSEGWLSSAFYVALPQRGSGASCDMAAAQNLESCPGWLSLGESRDLAPAVSPVQLIEPKPGRLILFPSGMWHGTRPFPAGERLTVAFDIARPRQY